MTRMLASVNSLQEAQWVLQAGVDIIDLKQPAQGALGALDCCLVKQIVKHVQNRKPVSATIGDLPMQPEPVYRAVQNMAETSVDYIKIGFFPGGDGLACIEKLRHLSAQGLRLIAVLFADATPNLNLLPTLAQAGFNGVMLDTMYKNKGSLMRCMSLAELNIFIQTAKQYRLLCGLAGSLKITDIAALLPLQADYLGFRGALCQHKQRTHQLDYSAVVAVQSALREKPASDAEITFKAGMLPG